TVVVGGGVILWVNGYDGFDRLAISKRILLCIPATTNSVSALQKARSYHLEFTTKKNSIRGYWFKV
ncbi:MAG: hypothetical protein ACK6A7_03655, partial [Planctomycetota bacterium]